MTTSAADMPVRPFGALCLLAMTSACIPAGAPPSFYASAAEKPGAAHGALIRYEPLPRSPTGAHAYRIIYQSTDTAGRLIAVSGMVIVPDGPAPAGGRPVLAWAHPTTGVQPRCAPSLSPLRFIMIPGLSDMLKRGFIVAATDYPGLGAGTVHPFLDGGSEGRAVLDSVRAAAAFPGSAANARFALWGHSQGGQAVLFAADLARSYTPELRLAGVAAAAPATELGTLFRDDAGTTGGNNLSTLTLWSWARVYGASYSKIVAPAAMPAVATIAHQCWDAVIESPAEGSADKVLAQRFFTVPDITRIEPWRELIARNDAPVLQRDIPVFLAQGDIDVIVRPPVTYNYMHRLCASGSRVTLDVLPKVGHDWAGMKSAEAAVEWIGDRMSDVPAPDDCGGSRLSPR